ncbi:MAG: Crp/Fnr family transcriptional regulator, partial [Anaerolineae bacterium]
IVCPRHIEEERMRIDDRSGLRAIALFAQLSDTTIDRLATSATLRTYAPDEHILLEDEPSRAAYFIVQGHVRVYRVSAEGREQVLVRLGSGQAFNTAPLFEARGRNRADVVALDEVACYVLRKEDLLQLVASHGDLALALLRDFAGRLTHLTDLVEGLALHTVQERLARFLLERAGPPTSTEGAVTQRWTQQEIATHLGTVRDVVGRELRALEDAGIVRIGRGRITLLDREALERIAGF